MDAGSIVLGPAGSVVDTLSSTKFAFPSDPPDLVVRPRLLDIVRRGVLGPLTLVSAPAGTGKTLLLASWAGLDEAPGPLTWMTLEAGDERPGVFWSYVVEALQRSGVDVAGAAMSTRPEEASGARRAGLARSIATHHRPVVLVLDDADRLVEPGLGAELADLLRHCDGNLRLVLLTRADPAMPLHLYRLDGTLTEIREAELSFTAEEAAAFLERSGVRLDPAQMRTLHERARGWAVGLRFAAMSLAGRADTEQALAEFTGDVGDVAGYLVSEVLDTQTPEMREILLRTSIVDHLSPGLVEDLTGRPHGRRILAFLAHGNYFLQPVTGGRGYRYQPLFREFLRAQLAYEQPTEVSRLHAVAAAHLARHGLLLDAARHAAAAGSWTVAAGYLVDDLAVGTLLAGRGGVRLAGLCAGLPEDLAGPAASVLRATLSIMSGQDERCGVELERAREQATTQPGRRAQSCQVSISVLEALLAERAADLAGGLASAALAERLLTAGPGQVPDPRVGDPGVPDLGPALSARLLRQVTLSAVVAGSRGRMLLRQGEFVPAQAELALAARLAEESGCGELRADSLAYGALADALNGRLRNAAELAERSRTAAREEGSDLAHAAALAALAWVGLEQDDPVVTAELVGEAAALRTQAPVVSAVLALVQAWLLRAQGDLEGALGHLQTLRRSGVPERWLDRWAAAAEATTWVALGRPQEAVELLEALTGPGSLETDLVLQQAWLADGSRRLSVPGSLAEPLGTTPLDSQVTAWLVQAARLVQSGEDARAGHALERALRLAEPERLRRPFREAGPAVQQLLASGSDLVTRHPWLGGVDPAEGVGGPTSMLGRRTRPSSRCADGTLVVDALTAKEREVLGHLAQLLTTEEIATTMFVSVNTVRTHVRSILRKLAAPRRNEAVRRAWELQLLPRRADAPPAPRLSTEGLLADRTTPR